MSKRHGKKRCLPSDDEFHHAGVAFSDAPWRKPEAPAARVTYESEPESNASDAASESSAGFQPLGKKRRVQIKFKSVATRLIGCSPGQQSSSGLRKEAAPVPKRPSPAVIKPARRTKPRTGEFKAPPPPSGYASSGGWSQLDTWVANWGALAAAAIQSDVVQPEDVQPEEVQPEVDRSRQEPVSSFWPRPGVVDLSSTCSEEPDVAPLVKLEAGSNVIQPVVDLDDSDVTEVIPFVALTTDDDVSIVFVEDITPTSGVQIRVLNFAEELARKIIEEAVQAALISVFQPTQESDSPSLEPLVFVPPVEAELKPYFVRRRHVFTVADMNVLNVLRRRCIEPVQEADPVEADPAVQEAEADTVLNTSHEFMDRCLADFKEQDAEWDTEEDEPAVVPVKAALEPSAAPVKAALEPAVVLEATAALNASHELMMDGFEDSFEERLLDSSADEEAVAPPEEFELEDEAEAAGATTEAETTAEDWLLFFPPASLHDMSSVSSASSSASSPVVLPPTKIRKSRAIVHAVADPQLCSTYYTAAGHGRLSFLGETFHTDKTKEGVTYWRCARRNSAKKLRCPATLKTRADGTVVIPQAVHNHTSLSE
jgi:hypothetical protein